MTAPLPYSSGAPGAQIECATAEIALKENLAAQERATALSAVAQRRSKLDFIHEGNPGERRNAAMQQMEGL